MGGVLVGWVLEWVRGWVGGVRGAEFWDGGGGAVKPNLALGCDGAIPPLASHSKCVS